MWCDFIIIMITWISMCKNSKYLRFNKISTFNFIYFRFNFHQFGFELLTRNCWSTSVLILNNAVHFTKTFSWLLLIQLHGWLICHYLWVVVSHVCQFLILVNRLFTCKAGADSPTGHPFLAFGKAPQTDTILSPARPFVCQ